jgi:tetratricopeptide (TPR) repeat protein
MGSSRDHHGGGRLEARQSAAPGVPGTLPRWVSEELARVTPRRQIEGASGQLEQAALSFVAGRYGKALHHAEEAKALSPRFAAVREILGLAAYRVERWEQALTELRTYRRLTGDTTHLPVEMDVLRALERGNDVETAYALLRRLGGSRAALDEGRVVYGSFLLDQDRAREAWDLTKPTSLSARPTEEELRVWYVAGRAAARLGDRATAKRLYQAIQEADPGFPGLDGLEAALKR